MKKVDRPLADPVPVSLNVSTTMPAPGSGAGFLKWNRVSSSGTGLQKAVQDRIAYAYDVSPDGEAVAVRRGSAVQVSPTHGGAPVDASTVCAVAGGRNRGITPPCVSWSRDGKFFYAYDRTAGQIYALPIPPGERIRIPQAH